MHHLSPSPRIGVGYIINILFDISNVDGIMRIGRAYLFYTPHSAVFSLHTRALFERLRERRV